MAPKVGAGSGKHILLVSLLSPHCYITGVYMAGLETSGPQETMDKARAVTLCHTQQKLRSL